MRLNKLLAIVYADLFDFPLTAKEVSWWAISTNSQRLSREGRKSLTTKLNGYEVLKDRKSLVSLRIRREKYSLQKEKIGQEIVNFLKSIPTIQSIFLTGSVAVGNAKKGADIDLMIICRPKTIWLTRLLVVVILKVKGLYRESEEIGDRICTNIYLDTNHLQIKEQNLFTAHEILQAKSLYDLGGVRELWMKENNWTRKYLPNAYKYSVSSLQYSVLKEENILIAFCLFPIELICFSGEYLYMKSKITNEKIGWEYAYFHPSNLSEKVLTRFNKKLASLGII